MIFQVQWKLLVKRLLEKRKNMLREKRSFIKLGTLLFGVPMVLCELWIFRAFGGIGFWLFVLVASFAVAWVWASLMWQIYKTTVLRKTESDSTAQKVKEGNK